MNKILIIIINLHKLQITIFA